MKRDTGNGVSARYLHFLRMILCVIICWFVHSIGFAALASAYSITVSTSDSISVDAVPNLNSGVGTAVVADELSVASDCRAGYSLSIAGPTDSNLYLDGDSSNNSAGTYFGPVDGSSALNATVNTNKWGYSMTADDGAGVFNAITKTATAILTPTQTASIDSDIDSKVSVYYGTSVDNNMIPGSYTFANDGRIVYQVVMDVSCVPGIHYEPNGADGGVGTMEVQEVGAGQGAYLVAPNYSREGYGFASWNTSPDGTGTNYGPNEYITMPASGVLTLYANWVASSGNLQGWTGCSSLSINDVIGLTDTRDGNVYAVAKLADGKCWMVESLRLDLEGADISVYNTNNPTSEFLEKLVDVTPNAGEWCVRTAPEASYDACEEEMNYNINNIDRSLEASYNTNGVADVSWYSYGVMYNNYTATAGGGDSDGHSICPIGWRLPTGRTRTYGALTQDYHALMYAWDNTYQAGGYFGTDGVDSRLAFAYPNNFIISGSYGEAVFRGRAVLLNGGTSERVDTSYWAVGGYMSGVGNSFTLSDNLERIIRVSDSQLVRGYNVRCIIEGDPENFTLSYNTNGGETVIPAVTVSANKVYSFTISSTVPQRTGYSFKWWIDKDGSKYAPGDTFTTIDVDSTLYAIWENNACNPEAETISQAVCLQDMNSMIKATMVSKQTYTLRDARDNKQYTVSLLDDGEVWMTQNLNMGGNAVMVLSSSDTDVEDEYYFLPAQTSTFTSDNRRIQYKLDNQYGGYYSWPAAILSNANHAVINEIVNTSICPYGWDLPLETHYNNLISGANIGSYGSAVVSPYSFVRGGYVNNLGIRDQGTKGLYWTAVVTSYNVQRNSDAKYVNLDSTFRVDEIGGSRYVGGSIRCIASNGDGTINYNANGGSGSMDSQNNIGLNETKIAENGFTEPNGHKQFREWNTRADGSGIAVKPGEAASIVKNDLVDGEVTLYAQWDDIYIVTLNNTDGGSTVVRKVVVGQSIYLNSSWTRTNYALDGWDTNPNGQPVVYRTGRRYTLTSDLVLYTVWAPMYTISYDGNGANSGSMNYTYGPVKTGTDVTLHGNDFGKTGYGFVGWSTNSAATPGDGTSVIYGPAQDYTIPSGGQGGNITMYAVWVAADSNNTMQYFGENGLCNNMSIGDVTGLRDVRDSNVYAVAKLADGKCWMMENLRLDPGQVTINSNNTDTPTSEFISKLNNYDASASICTDSSDPSCIDVIDYDANNIDRATGKAIEDEKYEDGVSYNWYTATAGNGNSGVVHGAKAVGSICPRGWHLLRTSYYIDYTEEFDLLMQALGSYTWEENWAGLSYPNNFLGSYYWSGVSWDDTTVVSISGLDAGIYNDNKDYRYHVRCVADTYEYTMEFDGNNYDIGGEVQDIEHIRMGSTIVMPSNGFEFDEQYVFSGWTFEEYYSVGEEVDEVYAPGESVTMDINMRERASVDGRLLLHAYLTWNPDY